MARQKKIICLFLAALWTVAVFGLSVNPVLSTTLQSSNYRVIDYNLGYGGGYSTSTAYAVQSNIELVVDAQKVAPANPPGGDGTITAPPPPPPPPPDTTPPIISSVQATNITTTGTNIVWSTNEAADSFVEYGATTAYGTSVSSSTLVTSHNLSLGGLTPATPYHFRVKSKDASSNQAVSVDYTFMTASLVDTAAPAISNIKVADITGASASILWDTDEVSTSQVKYGPTSAYGAVKTDSSLAVSHKVDLTGLVPDALYHFQVISADAKNNIATSGDQTFRTLDTIAPVISNIQVINILSRTANVTWVTNEATASQVFYRRQGESAYGSVSDSNLSVSHSMSLSGLVPNVAYEFYIVAKDSALNTATSALGSFKTLTDSIPPANIKNFTATPDDGLIVLTWQNPIDIDFYGVFIVRSASAYPKNRFEGEIVYSGSGISHTDTGLTNGITYFYTGFAYDTSLNFASGAITQGAPTGPLPPGVVLPGITPPGVVMPGEAGQPGIKEPVVMPPTVNLDAVSFWAANRTVRIYADSQSVVRALAGTGLGVSVDKNKIPVDIKILTLRVDSSNYLMKPRADGSAYDTDIVLPSNPTTYKGEITLIFEKYQQAITFSLDLKSKGIVFEEEAGVAKPIRETTVTLYELKKGVWQIWPGSVYYQDNPVVTDANGAYGFMVPDGTYYIEAKKSGYRENATTRFDAVENYVNQSLELIVKPKSIAEVVEPGAPVIKNAAQVAKNIAQKTVYVNKIVKEEVVNFTQNPIVEQVNANIAAPSLASVAVLNTAAAIPLFNLWTYLQYLIAQPLLFFRRKRRKAWGMIYNAFTKLPLDLAIVRLLDTKTKKILRTAVTDRQGRYVLFGPQGEFMMTSTKAGFIFPSIYLRGKKEDEAYIDLYHGASFEVKQDGQAIAYNLPMDPAGKEVSANRMIAARVFKGLQYGLSLSGIIFTAISLIITPSVKIGLFLILHIALFGLFIRLARPPKFKKWGAVTDAETGKPIRNAIVRLFEPEYNKLLGTQITNARGRYAFLVGRNIYYLTVEKTGYEALKTKKIDARTKAKSSVITEKIKLKKASAIKK